MSVAERVDFKKGRELPDRSYTYSQMKSEGWTDAQISDAFQIMSYELGLKAQMASFSTHWLGWPMIKWPNDLLLMAELIWDVRPALIIETGTLGGGSAMFFASVLDACGRGKIVSIDKTPFKASLPNHPRITYFGSRSSVDPQVVQDVKDWVKAADGPVMVVLDSDHAKDHVLAELDTYGPMVTPASWLIVEDVNLDCRPVKAQLMADAPHQGPALALEEWLPKHPDFRLDERKADRYLWSANSFIRRQRT